MLSGLKRLLVGRPLPTALARHERLSKITGLAIFAIVVPEFLPARWWQHLLHNQTALHQGRAAVSKGALLFRKNVIVTDVPYHLTH